MSSNQNKNSKNNLQPKSVSIDDIILFVESFEYNIESETANENQKKQKPKSQVQIRKENLAKLHKNLIQIKRADVKEPSTLKDRISKLYKTLKSKLGNDLYLLNIKIIIKFLQGYESTQPDKLTTTVRLFLNQIFEDVDKELDNLLNNTDLDLLANLFTNNRIEQNFSKIIRASLKEKDQDDKNGTTRILSYLYLYIVLNNRSRHNFSNQLFTVEHILAKYILEFQPIDKSKYLLKVLPEALIDRNQKTKTKSIIHIYLSAINKELSEEVQLIEGRLSRYQEKNTQLSSDITKLKEEGEEKDNEIAKLKEEGEEKNNEIAKLRGKLELTKRNLSYEINDLKRQLDVTKTGIVTNIKRQTKFALGDLTVIASRLPKNHGAELSDWIKHLKSIFDSL